MAGPEPTAPTAETAYGLVAALAGLLLLWFAIWTAGVNALVLAGAHYARLPWMLAVSTVLTALAGLRFARPVARAYSSFRQPACSVTRQSFTPLLAAVAFAIALAVHAAGGSIMLVTGASAIAIGAWWMAPRLAAAPAVGGGRALLAGTLCLTIVLLALYYFGHRPDWDDANYINLATGAQRSAAPVFALDTMVGDGPHPIHLPTYRIQSFELLGAALSTVTGVAPIAVIHLMMPAPQLLLTALVLALTLAPALGKDWLAAALFALAFLYADSMTLGSWGMHGLLRFFQGKGCLVTTLVPLAAGLTARYFRRGALVDLAGLALVHVCAIGFSANGLYVTPAASGFVALAFLVADPRDAWRRAPRLLPTLGYPLLLAAIIALRHMARPSEVTGATDPFAQFRFVVGWRYEGLALIALAPMAALAAPAGPTRRAAAVYLPLALAAVVNPFGWSLVSALTGNLGFRIFWAVPGATIAGAACARLLRGFPIGTRGWPPLAAALAALAVGIGYNLIEAGPSTKVDWRRPGLRVDEADYRIGERLVALTPAGCKALVPEPVAVWMAGMPGAPYLATVRSLYLTHYRFTMPADELADRWALFGLVNGRPGSLPTPAELARQRIRLGLVAIGRAEPGQAAAGRLAATLGLAGPYSLGGQWLYWRGRCDAAMQRVEGATDDDR